jgi:hypothetical protein
MPQGGDVWPGQLRLQVAMGRKSLSVVRIALGGQTARQRRGPNSNVRRNAQLVAG